MKNEEPEVVASVGQRICPSEEIRDEALASDPELMAKYRQLEINTARFANNMQMSRVLSDGTVEIPVVVNILYRTSAENVSDAQVQAQIDVLNADYSATNSDYSKIPSEFQSSASGNTGISFKVAKINRKSTNVRSWRTNDAMKKTSSKGLDATDPAHYLNIWV